MGAGRLSQPAVLAGKTWGRWGHTLTGPHSTGAHGAGGTVILGAGGWWGAAESWVTLHPSPEAAPTPSPLWKEPDVCLCTKLPGREATKKGQSHRLDTAKDLDGGGFQTLGEGPGLYPGSTWEPARVSKGGGAVAW